jgi:hypothetical protein
MHTSLTPQSSLVKQTGIKRTGLKSSTFKARNIGNFITTYPLTSGTLIAGSIAVFFNHTLLRKNIVPQKYPNSVILTFSDPLASQDSGTQAKTLPKGKSVLRAMVVQISCRGFSYKDRSLFV